MTATAPRVPHRAYAWFVGGIGSWGLAAGMHQVLFAWLLVGELHESPGRVGAAQTAQTLPWLLLLLVAGVVADRVDLRRLILSLHALAGVASLSLAFVVGSGRLSFLLLVGYALLWGSLQAFAGPSRDAMISQVAGPNLLRAVTGATAAQFLASALGSRTAAIGSWLGYPQTIGLQAFLLFAGLIPVSRLARTAPHPRSETHALASIREGLGEVRRSERLLPVTLLVAADGLFFNGPFAVLVPLVVRDVYGGDLTDLSVAMMLLPLGTIAGSLVLLLRGGLRHKGRAFLLGLFGVSACLLAVSVRPPFWGFAAAIFAWGVGHSVFFNTSRTLFQESAPSSHRARVLSVYSLAFLGMFPPSNLAAGFLAGRLGPSAVFAISGAAMIGITALAWFLTPVRRLR
jgi:MFS family permease